MQVRPDNSVPRSVNPADPARIVGVTVMEPATPDDCWHTVLVGGTVGSQAGLLVSTSSHAGETKPEAEKAAATRASNLGVRVIDW